MTTPTSDQPMPDLIARWHRIVETSDVAQLDEVLADEAVFRSPALHAPQHGKELTRTYLAAALGVLGPTLRYEREWYAGRSAVLEFHADLDGRQVHGVDMIAWDADDRIVDFTVMVRPLSGLQRLVELMGAALTSQR